jgi:hypothetical protein
MARQKLMQVLCNTLEGGNVGCAVVVTKVVLSQ